MQTCQLAVAALHAALAAPYMTVSRWYETAPMPPSGQPPYVNGVVRLDAERDPASLLQTLQDIEARFGRRRSLPNAARSLDLDIVAIGSTVRAAPDPVLPHPRMHLRAFVLRPMRDVAPDWRHPALHLTTAELLARLSPQEQRDVHPVSASHLRDAGTPPT